MHSPLIHRAYDSSCRTSPRFARPAPALADRHSGLGCVAGAELELGGGERPRRLCILSAAPWVNVSAKTIRRRSAAGDLRAYRCGKTIRIKTDDLEAMMRPVPSVKDW